MRTVQVVADHVDDATVARVRGKLDDAGIPGDLEVRDDAVDGPGRSPVVLSVQLDEDVDEVAAGQVRGIMARALTSPPATDEVVAALARLEVAVEGLRVRLDDLASLHVSATQEPDPSSP